uniref:Uncharacterized protein n=1 Tax=Meloidogyne incognita TaxID=6306 RepID=A0A914N906_MELIC
MLGGEYKLKIIKEKFVRIVNKLKDLGEEEALNKLDDIFKSSLAEIHLERVTLIPTGYGNPVRSINQIGSAKIFAATEERQNERRPAKSFS